MLLLMTIGGECDACGGTGWIQVRTRGMCGIECDFDEVETTACEVCDSGTRHRVAARQQVETDAAPR